MNTLGTFERLAILAGDVPCLCGAPMRAGRCTDPNCVCTPQKPGAERRGAREELAHFARAYVDETRKALARETDEGLKAYSRGAADAMEAVLRYCEHNF